MPDIELLGAASRGDIKLLKELIASGADVNRLAGIGDTPLHGAANHGKVRSISLLIDAGADIDSLDSDGMTPLMVACNVGRVRGTKAAMQLIELGANVNYTRQDDEMTPLKFATRKGTAELVQALIDRGAEVDGPRSTKQTALMIAAKENNVDNAEVLFKNGADINYQSSLPWAKGKTAEEIAEFSKAQKVAEFLRTCRMK